MEPATAAAWGTPHPDTGGHGFGHCGIHAFLGWALVPAQPEVPGMTVGSTESLLRRT